ncbi:MAG: hypothetical protein SCABRO_01222 [Candidatus Scalindua brodae]|uniref:Uncharacterized protein n=1 Tax=Candidatus Scalindua brodae TaxID=237368 RepID=A0A0B0EQR7_9BACT|nr:MAG: hypothetical protein SCABRO_01222 [Candidatus Scalindua brodae]
MVFLSLISAYRKEISNSKNVGIKKNLQFSSRSLRTGGLHGFAVRRGVGKCMPPIISAKLFIMLTGEEIMDKANLIKRFFVAFFFSKDRRIFSVLYL